MEPSKAMQVNAERIIEDVAGCGYFQIIFFIAVVGMTCTSSSYTNMFMAFGNYNPGWKCRDNITESTTRIPSDGTGLVNRTGDVLTRIINVDDYVIGSCGDYQKCDDVEFNPDTSTIVTEWGLVCDKSWIASLIISMQMVGMLVGAYVGGQFCDLIGRKKTLCLALLMCTIFQFISAFSTSWVMFMVLRVFIGGCSASIVVVDVLYTTEFMTIKWRAFALAIPVWTLGFLILTLTAWVTEDWQLIQLVGGFLSIVSLLITFFFAPESLRWLEVNNKKKEFIAVSRKIFKLNNKDEICFEEPDVLVSGTDKAQGNTAANVLYLFRKGYRMITCSLMFLHFSSSLIYYALSFGTKSLYGDFYFNLFLMNITPLVATVAAAFPITVLPRRHYTILFMSLTVVCSVVSIVILQLGSDEAKDIGSTVFICVARATLDAAWVGFFAFSSELYPTVVRGLAVGISSFAARVGGIVAPFLVPDDQSVLYIFMIIMTAFSMLCCVVSYLLPETKGRQLKETFDDGDRESYCNVDGGENKDDACSEQVL